MYRKNLLKTNKNKFWVLILTLFLCLSIGYAAISRTLSITGNSEVKQNTWDIHFENEIRDKLAK